MAASLAASVPSLLLKRNLALDSVFGHLIGEEGLEKMGRSPETFLSLVGFGLFP